MDWKYFYSEALGMRYAVKGRRLVTEDKTEYTADEAEILAPEGVDKTIHAFKRIFGGEIVGTK